MSTPHPHKDLIIAWANGAEIEYFSGYTQQWSLMEHPRWHPECTYRIKPKTVKVRAYRWENEEYVYFVPDNSSSLQVLERQAAQGVIHWVSNWVEVPLTK